MDALSVPAMRNGRCRIHGGKSTGPKTAEGRERIRRAQWRHGFYSQAAKAERAEARLVLRNVRSLIRQLRDVGQG